VVEGTARVTRGVEEAADQAVERPGECLGADDITRYDDLYGRSAKK
jgi:hypothetical protein